MESTLYLFQKIAFKFFKNVGSDDCESWNLKINFDKLFNESYRGLINKMTSDLVFVDTKLTKKDLEQDNFLYLFILKFKSYFRF